MMKNTKYYLYRLRSGHEPAELGCDLTIKECNALIKKDKEQRLAKGMPVSRPYVRYVREPMDY